MAGCENKNKKGQTIVQSEELKKLTNGKAINRADIEQVLIFSQIKRDKTMGKLSDSDISLVTHYVNSLFSKYQKERISRRTTYQKERVDQEIEAIDQDTTISMKNKIIKKNALKRRTFIGFKIDDAAEAKDAFSSIKKELLTIMDKMTDKDSELYIALENAVQEDVFGEPEKILDYIKELNDGENPSNVIQLLLKNRSFFVESINTDSLNTERVNDLDDVDNNEVVDNSKEESTPFGGSDKQKSLFDDAGKNVLRICKMLPKYIKEGDVYVPVKNKEGLVEPEDQLFVFTTLARVLTDFPNDAMKMYQELESKQEQIPFIKDLLDILGYPNSNQVTQQLIWSEFCQTFCKTYVPLVTWSLGDKGAFVKFSNSDLQKVTFRWRDNFKTVTHIPTIKKSVIGENYLDLIEFKKRHSQENNLLLSIYRKEFQNADPKRKEELANNIAKEVISIFEDWGIPYGAEDTKEQLQKSMATVILSSDKPNFFLDPVEVNRLLKLSDTTDINTVDKIISNLGGQSVDNFKKEFIKFSNVINPFSVRNANGDLQYEYLKNNFYTTLKKEINKSENILSSPSMQFLNPKEHEEMYSSIFLNSVYDLTPRKEKQLQDNDREISYTGKRIAEISLVSLSGIEYISGKTKAGETFQKLDRPTKLLTQYELARNGIFENPRAADKKTSLSISTTSKEKWTSRYRFGKQVVTFGGANREYFSQDSVSESKEKLALPQEANNYLLHELTLAIITAKKLGLDNIFLQFDDLVDTKTQELIKTALKDVSFENVDEIWREIDRYSLTLPKQFFKFFNTLAIGVDGYEGTASLLETAKKYGKGKIQDINPVDAALFFEINQWVHNNEVNKLAFGGIDAYAKEEYLKRTAGANSSGDNFRIDKAIDAFFNSEEDFSKTYSYQLQLENPEIYGNGLSDYKLKSQRVLNSGIIEDVNKSLTEEELTFIYESYKQRVKADLINHGLTEEKAEERADTAAEKVRNKYKNFTEADGQGYLAFDTYRQLCIKENQWSPEQEKMYQAECRGEYVNDIEKFFPVKKYQMFGPIIGVDKAGRVIRAFHKYSLMPLVPSLVKDSQLEIMHKRMCKEGIGYITYTSGSKIGNSGVVKMFKTKTVEQNGRTIELAEEELDDDFADLNKNVFSGKENIIDLVFLKDQLKMHDEYEHQVTSPTQLRGVIENVALDGGVPVDVKMSLEEWDKLSEEDKIEYSSMYKKLRKYEQSNLELSSFLFNEFLTECGITKTKTGFIIDKKKFRKALKGRLYSKDFSPNILSVLGNNLDKSIITSVGGIQFQKALFSLWNKKVIHQKSYGETLVQVASTGFRKFTTNSNGKVLQDNRLKFYRKDENGNVLPAQVRIALQGDYKKLLELTAPDGEKIETIERLNQFIKEDEVFRKQTEEVRRIVSARIPISSCNYLESYEIIEFLSEDSGNIIEVPPALVVKSGGDFDIDKLYTLFKSFDIEEGNIVEPRKRKSQAENDVVNAIEDILLSDESLLFLLTPDSTDEFDNKDFLERNNVKKRFDQYATINTKQGEKPAVTKSMMLSGSYNFIKGCVNSEGFDGLSICAKMGKQYSVLQRCNTVLNTNVPVYKKTGETKFSYETFIGFPCNRDSIGHITLGKLLNKDGQYIVNLATQYLSGSVDIAKGNDWIVHMTSSQSELGALVFMTRIGMSKDIIASFTSSPLIKKYVEFKRNRSSFLNKNLGGDRTKIKEFQEFLVRNGYSGKYNDIRDAVNFLKGNSSAMTLENLRKGTKSANLQYLFLMQYLVIEQIAGDITTTSLQIDTDTRPDDSIVSIQERNVFFKKALDNKTIFSADSMKRLMGESSLASFFKQKELEEIYKLTIDLPQEVIDVLETWYGDEKPADKQRHVVSCQESLFNFLYQLGSKPDIKKKIELVKKGEIVLYQGYVIEYNPLRSNTEAYTENGILTLGVNNKTTDYDALYAILTTLSDNERRNILAKGGISKIEQSFVPFEDIILNKQKLNINEIIPQNTEFDYFTEDGKSVHCVFGTLDLTNFNKEERISLYEQLLDQNPSIANQLSRDVLYINEKTKEVDVALNTIARRSIQLEQNLALVALSKIASRDINAMFGKTSISYSDMMMVILSSYPEILQLYPQLSVFGSEFQQDNKALSISNTKLTGQEKLEISHIIDRLASPNILNKTISELPAIDAFYIANFFSMFHTFASYQSGMNIEGTFGIMAFADPIEYNEVTANMYHSLTGSELGILANEIAGLVISSRINAGFNFVEFAEKNNLDLYTMKEEQKKQESSEEVNSGISNLTNKKEPNNNSICTF